MNDDELYRVATEQAEKLAPKLFRGTPRNPARIGPFTNKFMELWFTMSDLRFFQVVSVIETKLKAKGYQDGFNCEEPVILAAIQELLDGK